MSFTYEECKVATYCDDNDKTYFGHHGYKITIDEESFKVALCAVTGKVVIVGIHFEPGDPDPICYAPSEEQRNQVLEAYKSILTKE
jgi:hypothetical protein